MTDASLLDVREVSVSYAGAVRALHDVSMSVAAGSVVAVLGANGAGKSTLLRAISGTLGLQGGAVDGGAIHFDGRDLRGRDPATIVRAGLVQVPEGRRVFGELTVEENLRAGGLAAGDAAPAPRRATASTTCSRVLRERRRQRAGLLSGGEQQMLAIGRALMAARACCCSTSPRWAWRRRSSSASPRSSARSTPRARRWCWSSRTRRWRSPSPTRPTCSRSGACRSRHRRTSWPKSAEVQRALPRRRRRRGDDGRRAPPRPRRGRRRVRPPRGARARRRRAHRALRRHHRAAGRLVHGRARLACTR